MLESSFEPRHVPGALATLRASRVSAELGPILQHFDGNVRGIYRAAIHLEPRSRDDLLTLAIAEVGGLPGGILVEGVADLRSFGLERGQAVTGRGPRLLVGNGRLAIDVSGAHAWSPRLPVGARLQPGDRLDGMLQVAELVAASRAPDRGFGPLLRDGVWRGSRQRTIVPSRPDLAVTGANVPAVGADLLRGLVRALERDDRRGVSAAVRGFVGLGEGLTPSGDDLLVGLLAGLEATGHPALGWLAASVVQDLSGRTSLVSEVCLRRASRGEFPERLHDLLSALAGSSEGLVAWAVERAIAHGATSGADTLLGLFTGVAVGATRWRVAVA